MRLNPLSALMRSREISKLLGLPWFKLATGIVLSGYRRSVQMARMAIGFDAFKKGCTDGDVERGVLPLGQCTGLDERHADRGGGRRPHRRRGGASSGAAKG